MYQVEIYKENILLPGKKTYKKRPVAERKAKDLDSIIKKNPKKYPEKWEFKVKKI